MLNLKQKLYNFYKINLTYNHMCKILTELKKRKPWLYEADAVALQQCLKDLDFAYQKYFNGAGFPKFKSKRDKNSYRTMSRFVKLDIKNHTIKVPKIGEIKFRNKNKNI